MYLHKETLVFQKNNNKKKKNLVVTFFLLDKDYVKSLS